MHLITRKKYLNSTRHYAWPNITKVEDISQKWCGIFCFESLTHLSKNARVIKWSHCYITLPSYDDHLPHLIMEWTRATFFLSFFSIHFCSFDHLNRRHYCTECVPSYSVNDKCLRSVVVGSNCIRVFCNTWDARYSSSRLGIRMHCILCRQNLFVSAPADRYVDQSAFCVTFPF